MTAAALLAGCGGDEGAEGGKAPAAPVRSSADPQKLRVTLDGIEGAANVGIVMAVERGFFEDVGLDVWAGSPLEPSRPVQYVAKEIDAFGVAQQPQVVIGREKGADVVAVGSVIPQPTAAMIWLKESKIRSIADLEGKTIGFPGVPFQKGFLGMVLAQAGLTLEDVRVRNVRYEMVPTLLSGQVDAIFGGSWNLEGVELELAGAEPVIRRVQDLGIPDYEEGVVITRAELVDEDPQLVRDFMSAVARGTAAAAQDPEGAARAIKEAIGAVPDLHRKDRKAQLKATLPLLSRSGYMDPGQASDLVAWMHDRGLIQEEPAASKLLTNDYLP